MTLLQNRFVTVVSGLPRSGTSLMMQMLHAGGVPSLTDHARAPDDDNPRGYFEFEKVKSIKSDRAWLDDAIGKTVKMVHLLLLDLPLDRQYRVIMMRRDMAEVLKSQATMLQRSGKAGAGLGGEQLSRVYEQQMASVLKFLEANSASFAVLEVQYRDLIGNPKAFADRIAEFLGGNLDTAAMTSAVDPNLYRNRGA